MTKLNRNVPVRARDGCRLLTDVYTADDGSARPTLVHRTIYGKSDQLAGKSLDLAGFLRAGFNVVVQDLRGCHGSDGSFKPYMDDATDTADTVSWVCAQPWSTPAVGLLGRSYAGYTQWQAATCLERPTLGAIAPEGCSANPYDGWTYRNGVFRLGFCASWLLSDLLVPALGNEPPPAVASALAKTLVTPGAAWPYEAEQWLQAFAPYFIEWRARDRWDAYWEEKSPACRLDQLAIPALCINGWHDPFLECTFRDFSNVASVAQSRARINSRLVIGPWGHTGSRAAGGDSDLTALHVAWFERHLLNRRRPGDDPRVQIYLMGADRWLHLSQWPPASGLRPVKLFLGEGASGATGSLRAQPPPAQARPVELRCRWWDPVPTTPGGHGYFNQDRPPSLAPVACADAGDMVVRYATAPVGAPRVLLGEIRATLWVESSAPSFDLVLKLDRIAAGGESQALADGIGRVQRTALGLVKVDLSLGATGHLLEPGDRLWLELAGSNFPEYDVNRCGGGVDGVRLRVAQAAETPSHIWIPMYAGGDEEGVLW